MTRVQEELNLIKAEETKDLVSKLCGKLLSMVLWLMGLFENCTVNVERRKCSITLVILSMKKGNRQLHLQKALHYLPKASTTVFRYMYRSLCFDKK